jgi:kynurenine formamidase
MGCSNRVTLDDYRAEEINMISTNISRAFFSLIVLLSAVACSGHEPTMPKQFVDLSPTIGPDLLEHQFGPMIADSAYMPKPNFEHMVEQDANFYSVMSVVTMLNHLGSHADPPSHVFESGKSIDQIPLDRFYGEVVFFDFRSKPRNHPLTSTDFKSKTIGPDSVVIAYVGFEAPTEPGVLPAYPYLTGEAAHYLASLRIKAFGTDMPGLMSIINSARASADDPRVFEEHTALLEKEIVVIEGLANLDAIAGLPRVIFVGFPIKLERGTGGPLRAVGLVY